MIQIILPYPPSVNTYWRNLSGRTVLSKKGRLYKTAVCRAVTWAKANKMLAGRLDVRITLHPPDRRKHDIDNRMKGLLDGMQSAGVYVDDSQIDRLLIERGEIEKGGVVVVQIREIAGGNNAK